MRKLLPLLAVLAFVFSCSTVNLNDQKGMESYFDTVSENMNNLKSFEYGVDMDMLGLTVTLKGLFRSPFEAYLKMDIIGMAFEVYVQDKNNIFMKTGDDWNKVDESLLGSLDTYFNQTNQFKFLGVAQDVKKIDDKKIDNVDCYAFSFVVPRDKYVELMDPSNKLALKSDVAVVASIGKADSLIHGVDLKFEGRTNSLDFSAVAKMKISNHNGKMAFPVIEN